MVSRPENTELAGLVGLVVGFVVFTFGVLVYLGGDRSFSTVAVVIAGGIIGFVAAGWLVVYYFVMDVVKG